MNRKRFFVVVLLGVVIASVVGWLKASPSDDTPPGPSAPGSSGSKPSPSPAPGSTAMGLSHPEPEVLTGTPPVADPMREGEGILHVDVVMKDARPFADAQVTLYLQGPKSPATGRITWFVAGRGVTDATGALRLPARPGFYLVSAKARGYATARSTVTRPRGEDLTRVRLMLGAGATLSGTVVERASKAPVPLTELTLTPRTTPGSVSQAMASAPEEETTLATADERGAFRCEGLAPGEYQLDAVAPGHAPRRLARVLVPMSDLTVELDGSAFIEGFVELPEGGPAAGARVTATGMGDIRDAETSAGGAFSIEAPPGVYQVAAHHETLTGTAPEQVVLGPGMTVRDLRIRLGDAASITGVLRRRGSGEPVPGGAVSITPSTLAFIPDARPSEVASAVSGADGRFEAGRLAPGEYSIGIKARGFRSFIQAGFTVHAGQRLDVVMELDSTGRIEGTVVDGDNKPLAGILITPESQWHRGPLDGSIPTVSGADGAFTLEDVPPGEVFVAAQRPGSLPHVRERVEVRADATSRVRIQLTGEGVLEGTVRMEDGRALTGPVIVYAQRFESRASEAHQVSTSPEGTWSMRVREGRYRLSAWLSEVGNQNTDQAQVVDVEVEQTRRVDLRVKEAKRPHVVTVREPNGAPSIGAIVMVGEPGRREIFLEDVTNTSGQVAIAADALGSKPLHFWATNGGRRGEVASVPALSRDVVIQLQPGGRITGTVRSPGGPSIERFKLVASSTQMEDDFLSRKDLEFAGTRFTVDDLPAGRVILSVTLPDKRVGKAETTIVAGTTTQADIMIEAGGSVSGRLVDASGAPLFRAVVDVGGQMSPLTQQDGRFRVDDLPPGPHGLVAYARNLERAKKTVHITAGKTLDIGDWKIVASPIEPGRLGITFAMNGNDVMVRAIEEGLHVGLLRAGDVVMSIDGATVLTPGEARDRELGAPGSPATLVIRREARTYPITLTRAP
ncbi:carboxypeptidase regulatory-like domain-containing protein [Myxococcus stipitatus]|uniref:carboxypeptidase regulatory-like domain-containing protein n=1 Tax=Myxococcus stipitatus TaxID=83455 RepID=UPI0030D2F239